MNTSNTHTVETVALNLKGFNAVTKLIEDRQKEIRSIYALHKETLSIYKDENLRNFKGIELITPKGSVNPIFKDMVKGVNPFFLLFGTFSLSKVINMVDKSDYLGLMKSYNHSVLTYASLCIAKREYLLSRGEEISNLFRDLESKKTSKLEFSRGLIEFYPSLASELKKGKIVANVANWLFKENREVYDLLNVANAFNVELENVRKDIKTEKGNHGLIKFDSLLKEGYSLLSASKEIDYNLTIEVSTQAEKLAIAKASAKGAVIAEAKKADDKKAVKKVVATATLEALAQ